MLCPILLNIIHVCIIFDDNVRVSHVILSFLPMLLIQHIKLHVVLLTCMMLKMTAMLPLHTVSLHMRSYLTVCVLLLLISHTKTYPTGLSYKADITPSQFIYINGRWKMNDFNRCRFMRVYKDDKKPCGFHVGANPGKVSICYRVLEAAYMNSLTN